jgi:DNA modification methylase
MVELNDFAAVKTNNAVVFSGSNLDVLPFMADNSVDAIVTDPPYELGFMGKSWDSSGIAYSVELWRECLRVLKPGGHLLAFGGSRTWHRIAVAIEDAGFDVRDSIAWLYGSGFPKSHDISKGIDKAAGVEREVVTDLVEDLFGEREIRREKEAYGIGNNSETFGGHAEGAMARETAPATDEAKKWQGWGTALKPAFEPVVVARKPLVGTVAANVLEWGVGGLNIDASRIGTEAVTINTFDNGAKPFGDAVGEDYSSRQSVGRWPANVVFDEACAELLDEQSGITKSPKPYVSEGYKDSSMFGAGGVNHDKEYGDTGGASRFFYVAKASKRDRNEGLEGLPETKSGSYNGNAVQPDGNKIGANPERPNKPAQNFHPTVKPTELMRYLIKLVTPAGGVVLDPFTGSGSTGKAALLDGYQFLGIELTDDYLPIIQGRLEWAEAESVRVAQAAAEKETERLF